MSEWITHTVSGGIAEVRLLARTMPPAFFDDCDATFAELERRDDVRVVVIASNAKAFSYGLDLPAAFKTHGNLFIGGGLAADRTELLQLIRRWQHTFSRLAKMSAPVVVAVHGPCIGGGLDLISAADIRLASEDAYFSLREAAIGIVADLGSLQRLPTIIGEGQTRSMAFTAENVPAPRAEAIGLVSEVLPDRDALLNRAHEIARTIADHPPLAIKGVKEVLNFSQGKSISDGLDYVAAWNAAFLSSEDLAEAMSAFVAKRKPVFKGR